MQTKNIPIFIFILVFAGVALLGYSPAQGAPPPRCVPVDVDPPDLINLGDGYCTQPEIDNLWATQLGPYCIELISGTPDEGGLPYNPDTCGGASCQEYTWQVSTIGRCQGVNSWSHLSIEFFLCGASSLAEIILDPPQAYHFPPGEDETSCGIIVDPDYALAKWVPSVACVENCSGPNGYPAIDPAAGTFSVYAAAGSGVGTVLVAPKFGDNCMEGYTLGPSGGASTYIPERPFSCGPDTTTVRYDSCGGNPYNVIMQLESTSEVDECYTRFGYADWPIFEEEGQPDYVPRHFGPRGIGVHFCLDAVPESGLPRGPHMYCHDDDCWYGRLPETGCPTIRIADVSVIAGSEAVFTVTLSEALPGDLTVNYATSDGTATAPQDYASTSDTLIIAAGSTSATIAVQTSSSGNGTFNVNLTNANLNNVQDNLGVGTISSP